MSKKEDKVLSILQSKRFLILFTVFLAAVFTAGWGLLVWNENRVVVIDSESIPEATDGEFRYGIEELIWQEDGVSITKDFVRISGWIVKPGEEIQTSAIWVVLKDSKTGIYYRLPTELTDREDVTDWMNDGLSYMLSGFYVCIPRWKALDTDTDYKVYVLDVLNGTEKMVSLGTTLKTWTEDSGVNGPAGLTGEGDG